MTDALLVFPGYVALLFAIFLTLALFCVLAAAGIEYVWRHVAQ